MGATDQQAAELLRRRRRLNRRSAVRDWLWRNFRPGSVGQGVLSILALLLGALFILGVAWVTLVALSA